MIRIDEEPFESEEELRTAILRVLATVHNTHFPPNNYNALAAIKRLFDEHARAEMPNGRTTSERLEKLLDDVFDYIDFDRERPTI